MQEDEEFAEADDLVSSFLSDDFRDQVDFTGGSRRSFFDHSIDGIVSITSSLMPTWHSASYEIATADGDTLESASKAPRLGSTPPAASYAGVTVKTEPVAEPLFSPVSYLSSFIPGMPNVVSSYPPPGYDASGYPIKDEQPSRSSPLSLVIIEQPAIEVRTRTPSENRTFSLSCQVIGDWASWEVKSVRAVLEYAAAEPGDPGPSQAILGGHKVVPIGSEGRVVFDNLCMSEASTRHKEKEFRLELALVKADGRPVGVTTHTRPFYAYSHKRVLSRRRNIKLCTLNKPWGSIHGGEAMHAIGTPFINGPSLKVLFRTPHGDAAATNVQMYSETVIFFRLPAYPAPSLLPTVPEGTEVRATVVVTNDSKTFSNALDFTFVAGVPTTRSLLLSLGPASQPVEPDEED